MHRFIRRAAFVNLFLIATSVSSGAVHAQTLNPPRSSPPPEPVRMCPMFEPSTYDNMGFKVVCDERTAVQSPAPRRCQLFPGKNSYDQQGFTVACPGEEPLPSPPKTCPMFTPQTWDTMGFRVPC